MCVILLGTARNLLALDLEKAWRQNSDGAGLVITPRKSAIAIKGLMTLDAFLDALRGMSPHLYVAAHLRLATHGSVTPGNTHPHKVPGYGWLLHNGIATGFGRAGTDGNAESDSAHVARILGRVEHRDHYPILNAITGKFVTVSETGKVLYYGHFSKIGAGDRVLCSNTAWMYPLSSSYYQGSGSYTPATTGTTPHRYGPGWSTDSSGRHVYQPRYDEREKTTPAPVALPPSPQRTIDAAGVSTVADVEATEADAVELTAPEKRAGFVRSVTDVARKALEDRENRRAEIIKRRNARKALIDRTVADELDDAAREGMRRGSEYVNGAAHDDEGNTLVS